MSVQNFNWGTRSGAASASLTVSLTLGSGVNRKLVVAIASETSIALNALTYDGTTLLANLVRDEVNALARSRLYYYDIPDAKGAGSYNVVATFASSTSQYTMYCWQLQNAATGAPEANTGANNATGNSISTSLTASASADVIGLFTTSETGSPVWSSPMTLRQAGGEANYRSLAADTTASGGSVTIAVTGDSSGVARSIVALSVAAILGPTITVQPVADTVILTNETTATFSVTATGTGSLTYDWELETSVGGGSYSNLADGNGATWTGQAASSCTATLTAKTLSGRRVRCNVTDDNGTTTTDAVALTIFDGPQVTTFPATNASGVSTATLTCDYVTGTGEAIEVAIVLPDGRVAVTTTTTA